MSHANQDPGAPAAALRLSVVIPTYERAERAARLVEELGRQTLLPEAFEVIVVDDGSKVDPRPRIEAAKHAFRLVIERQENQGAAAARHRGVELASAEVVLFLDDDMIPSPRLLEEHLAVHAGTPRAVVMGRIASSRELARLPLFERFHARNLEELSAALRATGRNPSGTEVYSGNLSLRRADYLAVGGFDRTLPRSEDMELGFRLERAGAAIRYCDAASSIHDSDHTDPEGWLKSAFKYGATDERIARKHPDAPGVGPFRYLDVVSVVPMPGYALAILAPSLGHAAVRAVLGVAQALDRIGLERPAFAGAMLAYGMEYYRGVRAEAGSAAECARELAAFRRSRPAERPHARTRRTRRSRRRAALARLVASVRADHEMLLRSDAKYDTRGRKPASLAHDLVERIGFQMLGAIRLMRFFKEAGSPLGAKIAARMIRLIYGGDIHWNAEFADGVSINHGMGLAIGHSAKIAKGVILSHNVGIGDGIDLKTRAVGQPTIEEGVHIGPNAVLLGPITIGARSKIGPGVVLMQSVPPDSIVEPPAPTVRPRAHRPAAATPAEAPAAAARAPS
jgi:serine acetyltransferase/GT2 family glycosyltransferase